MAQITRMWLGFAGVGTGLIHLALVVSSPLPLAIALVVLGFTELGWGVFTFAKDSLIAPSVARIVAVAPIVLWSLLVVLATLLQEPAIASSLPLLPMLVTTAFEVFVAAVLSVHLRRRAASTDTDAAASVTPPAGRYLLALFAGAMIVAGMTTPALAATEAGRYAQPHGEHTAGFVPQSDDTGEQLEIPEHEGH